MFERFGRTARIAVVLAQEEARELRADDIRPEHLLVGVLQSAGRDLAGVLSGHGMTAEVIRSRLGSAALSEEQQFEDDAEALRSIGIDLRAVRDKVASAFGENAWNDASRGTRSRKRRYAHLPFTKAAKKVLELSLREALAHKDSTIGCEHIVLGIMRSGDPVVLSLIGAHVDVATLRADINHLLDEAA